MPELWVCTNWPYPGSDGTTARWLGQRILAQSLGATGFRATHAWAETTTSGPSSPSYTWWTNLARECAAYGFKLDIGIEIAVNDHAGWQTLAGDAPAWTEYVGNGPISTYPPPSGSSNALWNKQVELITAGLTAARAEYTAVDLDPDEYIRIHGPNEVAEDWLGQTSGNSTYTFQQALNVIMPGLRAAFPSMTIGSPVVHGMFSGATNAAETSAHVTRIETLQTNSNGQAHMACYDILWTNFYLNDYLSGFGDPYKTKIDVMAKGAEVYQAMKLWAADVSSACQVGVHEFGGSVTQFGLNRNGNAAMKNRYREQGAHIGYAYDSLMVFPWTAITVYCTGADDDDSSRMFSLTVGSTAIDTVGTLGQWRSNAEGLLNRRGWDGIIPEAVPGTGIVVGPTTTEALGVSK